MSFEQCLKGVQKQLQIDKKIFKETGNKSKDLKKCEAFLKANGVEL